MVYYITNKCFIVPPIVQLMTYRLLNNVQYLFTTWQWVVRIHNLIKSEYTVVQILWEIKVDEQLKLVIVIDEYRLNFCTLSSILRPDETS